MQNMTDILLIIDDIMKLVITFKCIFAFLNIFHLSCKLCFDYADWCLPIVCYILLIMLLNSL